MLNDQLKPDKKQTIEIIDPTKVEPIRIKIDDNLKTRLESASAKGVSALRVASENRALKKRELVESDNINEVDLETILTKDDHLFYQEKKRLYIEAYPDLGTDPFDLDDLHLMLMEQVFQRNLLKRKKKHPTVDIAKDYQDSVKRQGEFKKSLSMRRTDRVKNKQGTGPKINIANLSLNFNNPSKLNEMQKRVLDLQTEEEGLVNRIDKLG